MRIQWFISWSHKCYCSVILFIKNGHSGFNIKYYPLKINWICLFVFLLRRGLCSIPPLQGEAILVEGCLRCAVLQHAWPAKLLSSPLHSYFLKGFRLVTDCLVQELFIEQSCYIECLEWGRISPVEPLSCRY